MIRALPLVVGLAPVLVVALAYWLGVRNGVLPSCMPLLDGCTSISATGRYQPGSLLFKAVMLPQAAWLLILWWLAVAWLRQVTTRPRRHTLVLVSGATGALALVVYVTLLGTGEPLYEYMRRFGIWFYFLGTALAQLLLSRALPASPLRKAMQWVVAAPFILGLGNLAQKAIVDQPDNIENRIEWIAALLMQLWFVLLYIAWQRSGISITVQTDPPSDR
jgi:hypothetical protein